MRTAESKVELRPLKFHQALKSRTIARPEVSVLHCLTTVSETPTRGGP